MKRYPTIFVTAGLALLVPPLNKPPDGEGADEDPKIEGAVDTGADPNILPCGFCCWLPKADKLGVADVVAGLAAFWNNDGIVEVLAVFPNRLGAAVVAVEAGTPNAVDAVVVAPKSEVVVFEAEVEFGDLNIDVELEEPLKRLGVVPGALNIDGA